MDQAAELVSGLVDQIAAVTSILDDLDKQGS